MTYQQAATGQQAATHPQAPPPPEGPPRAHHDMGGVPKFLCEGIDTGPHTLTEFDRTVDALRGILGAKGVMSVDELRRGIEAIPEADYLRLIRHQ